MDLQILRDWVLRYNAEGFEGLADRARGGSESWLTAAQIAEVGAWIEAGPDLDRDGVTRWRVQDIVRKIEEAFGVVYTESGARMMLRRAGFRFLTGTAGPSESRRGAAEGVRGGLRGASDVAARPGGAGGTGRDLVPGRSARRPEGDDDAGLGAWQAAPTHRARPPLRLESCRTPVLSQFSESSR